jgi:hypothetical protein
MTSKVEDLTIYDGSCALQIADTRISECFRRMNTIEDLRKLQEINELYQEGTKQSQIPILKWSA